MLPLKARVENGRLVLNEPTSLPEGQVVYLEPTIVPVDPAEFDEDERATLHAELEASIAEAEAGEADDFATFLASLRQRS